MLHVDERTIRFAWTLDGVETTSQIEVAEDEDGTLVTLSQTDLPSFEDVIADRAGARGDAADVLVPGDRQPRRLPEPAAS